MQLVRSLERYVVTHGKGARRTECARVLVADSRGEPERLRGGQLRGGGLEQIDRCRLEGSLGDGAGRFCRRRRWCWLVRKL